MADVRIAPIVSFRSCFRSATLCVNITAVYVQIRILKESRYITTFFALGLKSDVDCNKGQKEYFTVA